MKLQDTTHRLSLTTALCVATLLVASSPTATPFGDNDGGLDLPGMQNPDLPGSGNSGGSSNQQTSSGSGSGTVSVAGSDVMVHEISDAALGWVTIADGTDNNALVLSLLPSNTSTAGSGSVTQDALAGGQGVSAAVESGQISLQGSVLLPGESPYERHLNSPLDAVATQSLLIVDSDPGASLEALLSSKVALDHWRLVDDPVALDLNEFAQRVQNKAELLASNGEDVRVTWLIATLDSAGQMHLSAARVSTLGGAIEVVTQ